MSRPDGAATPGDRRRMRHAFLRRLYDVVDASVTEFVNGFEVAAGVGAGRDEAARLFDYFEERGFVKVDDHRTGTLRITAAGIDEVEARDE
jgi:fatty acid-binding protein DegV